MANKKNIEEIKRGKKGGVAAGITGAVVGASVGVAANRLSDKKTRKAVMNTLSEVKDDIIEVLTDVKRK